MAEQVQEEEGITLGQIFKAMFFNKIRFLIVSVATFVVLLIGILVVYNPGKKTYVAKFKYSDINIANGHYSNGKTFNTQQRTASDRRRENPSSRRKDGGITRFSRGINY